MKQAGAGTREDVDISCSLYAMNGKPLARTTLKQSQTKLLLHFMRTGRAAESLNLNETTVLFDERCVETIQ